MSTKKGLLHENTALDYLVARNLKPVRQNFRAYHGEIDLIMEDNNSLVFVEVKYRKHNNYGRAQEFVTRKKQQHIIHTAEYFLQTQKQYRNWPCRFDVIAMNNQSIDWIKNAFQTT